MGAPSLTQQGVRDRSAQNPFWATFLAESIRHPYAISSNDDGNRQQSGPGWESGTSGTPNPEPRARNPSHSCSRDESVVTPSSRSATRLSARIHHTKPTLSTVDMRRGSVVRWMMTKQSAALILLLSVFAVSVLLTTIEGYHNLGDNEDARLCERLGVFQGHVAPLFATSFVWSRYPAAPNHLTALVDRRAFLTTIPLLLIALYFARIRGRRPFPLLIAICLAVAAVPYITGMIMLRGGTMNDLQYVGRWLAVMLLGPLYALVACAVICIVELLRPDPRHRSLWGRLPLECPPLRTPAPHR